MRRSAGLARWFVHQQYGCMSPEEHSLDLTSLILDVEDLDFPNLYEENTHSHVAFGPGTRWLSEGLSALGNDPALRRWWTVKELLKPGMAN